METLSHWFGPLHPPVTHFPIACSLLALLAYLYGRLHSEDWVLRASGALWLLALIGGLTGLVTGHLFAHHLAMLDEWTFLPPETAMKGKLREHVELALTGTLFCAAGAVFAWALLRGRKPNPWAVGLLLLGSAAFLGLAGHEGGEMVYEDAGPVAMAEEEPAATPGAPEADGLWKRVGNYRRDLVLMDSSPWNSRTHGHRWVNTYVSPEAAQAYRDTEAMPEGALVVKESFEDSGEDGPSKVPGPLYVMEKGKRSESPRTGGWRYALRWDHPVEGNPERIKGPVTWVSGDPHLNSCVKCHGRFKDTDYMAGVPEGHDNP
ncbi:MAG TPA: cytochrome P460 family protein [bacterium]|nr:cytochrome P460 family protein [bacterium]